MRHFLSVHSIDIAVSAVVIAVAIVAYGPVVSYGQGIAVASWNGSVTYVFPDGSAARVSNGGDFWASAIQSITSASGLMAAVTAGAAVHGISDQHATQYGSYVACANGVSVESFAANAAASNPPAPSNNSSSDTSGTSDTSSTVTDTWDAPSNSCSPRNVCSGDWVVDSCSGGTIEHCPAGCSNGTCIAPPALVTVQEFEARPSLVRSGSATTLYWEYDNVASCSISGTNGDTWSTASAGDTGAATSLLSTKTTFTLSCTGLDGSNVTESATVNIAPVFFEM